MTPTPKAPATENVLTKLTGISRQEAAKKKICVMCKGPVAGFRDALSEREYSISGLCQHCQDQIFGGDE
jgi:hypothetical protein